MSLLNFNFPMIYITHKMLISVKNHPNYLKDIFFECFLKEYSRILFFLIFFFLTHKNGKFKF